MTMIALIGLTEKKRCKNLIITMFFRNDNGWSFASLDVIYFIFSGN